MLNKGVAHMKYCTYCGKELKDDETFCPNCGTNAPNVPSAVNQRNVQYQSTQHNESSISQILQKFGFHYGDDAVSQKTINLPLIICGISAAVA